MPKKRVPPEKAPHGVLFKRTQKQWARSINDHIGKILDNSSIKDIEQVAISVGLAIHGYTLTKDPRAAIMGPLAFKLATSPSEVAASSGIIMLAAYGIASVPWKELGVDIPDTPEEMIDTCLRLALGLPGWLSLWWKKYLEEQRQKESQPPLPPINSSLE